MSEFRVAANFAKHPPVELEGGVEFDPGDPKMPVSLECDGYMSLAAAKAIHAGLTEAIRRAEAGEFRVVPQDQTPQGEKGGAH